MRTRPIVYDEHGEIFLNRRGWFAVNDLQDGHRTLDEQMMGLEYLLEEVDGKSVADLGCAEALILRKVRDHGAFPCFGCDNNVDSIRVGRQLLVDTDITLEVMDLNLPQQWERRYDVVLLLAVLHKLQSPEESLRQFAELAKQLIVIRLPTGSDGEFKCKFGKGRCNTKLVLTECGFALERDVAGPRGERVHYWRRRVG